MQILKRIHDTLWGVYELHDNTHYDHPAVSHAAICGVYHVMCMGEWEKMVHNQMECLRDSGLLDATERLYVSVVCDDDKKVQRLREIINTEKLEIISVQRDAKVYEYPALKFLHAKSKDVDENTLFYYFHTKGISYFSMSSNDKTFLGFRRKIRSWCEMLEHFVFWKWNIAVNALQDGYDTYGCYRWPPRNYTMYSGSYWWAKASYVRTLPDFRDDVISSNRFYSEVWLYEHRHRDYSAFDTIADLYYVNIPRSIYTMPSPPLGDHLRFVLTYNWRKLLKHAGYSYKHRCQKRYQS